MKKTFISVFAAVAALFISCDPNPDEAFEHIMIQGPFKNERTLKYYLTLKEAGDEAQDADTILLMYDFDSGLTKEYDIEKNLTLDLQGNTMTSSYTIRAGAETVNTNGTLTEPTTPEINVTMKNGNYRFSFTTHTEHNWDGNKRAALCVFSHATLTVENAHVTSSWNGVYIESNTWKTNTNESGGHTQQSNVWNKANLVVRNSTIECPKTGISMYGGAIHDDDVTVEGSTVVGTEQTAIYYNQGGNITVRNSTLVGGRNAFFLHTGGSESEPCVIENTTLRCTADSTLYDARPIGSTDTNHADNENNSYKAPTLEAGYVYGVWGANGLRAPHAVLLLGDGQYNHVNSNTASTYVTLTNVTLLCDNNNPENDFPTSPAGFRYYGIYAMQYGQYTGTGGNGSTNGGSTDNFIVLNAKGTVSTDSNIKTVNYHGGTSNSETSSYKNEMEAGWYQRNGSTENNNMNGNQKDPVFKVKMTDGTDLEQIRAAMNTQTKTTTQ